MYAVSLTPMVTNRGQFLLDENLHNWMFHLQSMLLDLIVSRRYQGISNAENLQKSEELFAFLLESVLPYMRLLPY